MKYFNRLVKAFASTFLVLMSLQIFTGIEVTTIDSWRIVNAGSHSLLVNKFSENPESDNGFLFEMQRPHCLCAEPTFVLYTPDDEDFVRPIEGTPIEAELRVDFKKWKQVELEVFLALEDRQSNILRLKGTFPSLRDAKVIQLDSMYGSDTWVLKHIDKAMEQATKLCESFIPYEEEQVKETKGKKV